MARHAKKNRTVSTSAKVAAAGIALGAGAAVLAPTAGAAPYSDWDRLAECESGGDWHINTGNGFYGGLQFHPQTWTGHGGGEFAATADQASREQQIWVAEKVLASQGWGAWPACSAALGLNSAPTERPKPGAETSAATFETDSQNVESAETDITALAGDLDLGNIDIASIAGGDLGSVQSLVEAVDLDELEAAFADIVALAGDAGVPVPAQATAVYEQMRAQF